MKYANTDHDSNNDIDTEAVCLDCRNPFTITAGEHEWFRARDWTVPKRCPSCRQARRSAVQSSGVCR